MVHRYNAGRLTPTLDLDGFARKVHYGDLSKPDCISEPRWSAMLSWWKVRQSEGVSLGDFGPFGSYTQYFYDD